MKSFIYILFLILGLFIGFKLLRRLIYKIIAGKPYRFRSGNAGTALIKTDFYPRHCFTDGDNLYFSSEKGSRSYLHRLEGSNFVNFFQSDRKLMAVPLISDERMFCVLGNKLEFYRSLKMVWQADIKKSPISGNQISPRIDEDFLYFPESDLILGKHKNRAPVSDQAPGIKRFNIDNGRIDLELPLSYIKSRYGFLSGCDTNLVFDDCFFYAGLQTGYFYKIDKRTFMAAWSVKLPETSKDYRRRTDFDFDPILDEKYAYIGYNGLLCVIDKESAEIKARVKYYQEPGSMVLTENSGYFSTMGSIYRLDKDTLKEEQFVSLNRKYIFLTAVNNSIIAALATSRRPAYKRLFNRYSGILLLLNAETGEKLLELEIYNIGNPAIKIWNNRLVIRKEDNAVMLIDIPDSLL